MPNRNFRDFSLLHFDFKCWNCPAWYALAANAINGDSNSLVGHSVSV